MGLGLKGYIQNKRRIRLIEIEKMVREIDLEKGDHFELAKYITFTIKFKHVR